MNREPLLNPAFQPRLLQVPCHAPLASHRCTGRSPHVIGCRPDWNMQPGMAVIPSSKRRMGFHRQRRHGT